MIKPIETAYNGYRFRSRLEARWAVFFDALEIKYQYEPEGFDIDGIWYLPDFWLPDFQEWIEIKPTENHIDSSTHVTLWRFYKYINAKAWDDDQGSAFVYIIAGDCYLDKYKIFLPDYHEEKFTWARNTAWAHCPLCRQVAISLYEMDFGLGEGVHCMHCDCVDRNWKETKDAWFNKGVVETRLKNYILQSPYLVYAYNQARQARFEHGESPIISSTRS